MIDRPNNLARRSMAGAGVIALALVGTACGNVTAGGFSEVTVSVSGDSPDPAPQPAVLAASPAWVPAASQRPLPSSHEEAEGEVEIDFTLALLAESGEVVSLGEDDIRIKLDLQGVDEAEVVRELVPVARYVGLRLTFIHIKVEVSGGLVIDGVPIVGEVEVELEDPELVVERPLDIEPTEGSTVEMVVDLNTPAWLAAVDPVSLTIDASVFAGLVDVVVR